MKRLLTAAIAFALAPSLCPGQTVINTFAGAAACCNGADGLRAVNAWLTGIGDIATDSQGNTYILDDATGTVRKINPSGVLSTVAGTGTPGFSGDGGLATSAQIFPRGRGFAVDPAGNIYISDANNQRIRKVNTAGIISTYAGNGSPGYSGDGGLATSAMLFDPAGLALDAAGNLYIADTSNQRVRMVTPGGIISTVAGNGNVTYDGDEVLATRAAVRSPEAVTVDGAGNLYISETSEARVRKVDASGIIHTIAGQTRRTRGFSGDGGLGTAATMSGPSGLAVDAAGNLYIADNGNARVRKVDAAGIITTYAGNGTSQFSGDGGPAINAGIGVLGALALDSTGALYIGSSTTGVKRIRKVTASGPTISAVPTSLAFAYTIGGAAPASQTFAITSTGAALSFAAASTGGSWLSVSPVSGTTPATLTVSVNPAGLPGGVYSGAITITPSGGASPQSFAVTLTVSGAGAPVFLGSSVLNATGYQNKLAPGTIFVIFGSGMGPASIIFGSGPNYPVTLGGTSITFTPASGGAPITAKMVYSSAGQIAGLLPSSITPGVYAVRVTNNTLTSAPQNVTVVARSFGIATANSAGTGTAQATIGNVNNGLSLVRFTTGSVAFGGYTWTLSPARPGDALVLWGTGGGADPANDTGGTSGDQTAAGNFTVTVSGRVITPFYAGASSGFPGLWQVNFTLPSDIAPDCFAQAQVSTGGELSNSVVIPIAAAGESACSAPGLTPEVLSALDAGERIAFGGFGIARSTQTTTRVSSTGTTVTVGRQESVGGGVGLYSAAQYAAIFAGIKIGACTVTDRTAPSTVKPPSAPDAYVDFGTLIPVSGPNVAAGVGMVVASANPGPIYSSVFSEGTIAGGGAYSLGGPFNVSVTFPSSFAVTGFDALSVVDRTKPLTLNWTGSGAQEELFIIFSTSRVLGNLIRNVVINCQVPGLAGTYTIPASALAYLLTAGVDTASLATGAAILTVETVAAQPFTPSLPNGVQPGAVSFRGILSVAKNLIVE